MILPSAQKFNIKRFTLYASRMASDDLPGINRKNIAGWLTERSEVTGEIRFDVVTHGRSNLTYKLEDEAGRKAHVL